MPIFTGTTGNDTLVGGSGPDTLIGLTGNDSYFVNDAGDEIVEAENEGYDIVYAAVHYILTAGAHVEALGTVDNTATTAINLTGNERDNYVTGNAGANILDGGGGADQLWGREGDDSYFVDGDDSLLEYVGQGFDIVYARSSYVLAAGMSIEVLRTADDLGVGGFNLTGNELANLIVGNAGINILRGGGGLDTLQGLAGDDTYFVDGDDVVTEASGQGNDIVYASASYVLSLGAHVEALGTVDNLATDAIDLTGNELANYLVGNAGANILRGGGGGDRLEGRQGDDTYFTSNSDIVIEKAGEGYDTLYFDFVSNNNTTLLYRLQAGVEIEELRISDNLSTQHARLIGNEFDQRLFGNDMINVLDGGGGSDILAGGRGGDDYVIQPDDIVIEAVGEGVDTLSVTGSYVLPSGVEIETIAQRAGSLTEYTYTIGNEFNQLIRGGNGIDRLDGGGGSDTLVGLDRDDIYFVDTDDIVIEADHPSVGGNDTVYARSDFVLTSAFVEVLATADNTATTAIALTGSSGNQYITGNAGINRIDGGGGSDTMWGREGDDSYVNVSNNDVVIEYAGQGNDTILVAASYSLTRLDPSASIEVLRTTNDTATTAIDLTGNGLANQLIGNAGQNRLDGGGGSDTLQGLGGVDIFAFTTALGAGNVDTIVDFVAGEEKIYLDDAVFTGLGLGALPAGAFRTGTTAQDADDRILYDTTTGALYFDADGVGGAAAVQFATLSSAPTISANDFTVI